MVGTPPALPPMPQPGEFVVDGVWRRESYESALRLWAMVVCYLNPPRNGDQP